MKPLDNDPLWFKDAIIYELHVRAFSDSNGDGIGDFTGLIDKLDYLSDLGVTALWLLPFYPSPLRDDGYDIADYTDVNPSYGTMKDFRRFLDAAHDRGLRVITELVINHTSDQHAWFQRARRSPPGSSFRDFYVWSDNPDRYRGTRIIFQDFETSNWTWDPVANSYYWHRFYHHQPDLNFDNPAVQEALLKVLDMWMEMGVDGLRLDAVPYLYEREGTNNENLPETHDFLRKLRTHIDAKFPNRMLLAEANQWPEDAAQYFGNGDECHMNFHFPLMPRMFMAVQQENSFPILDILEQTPVIPESCQWAVFLRNHDELTLEMVTDADRDYMYRQYAMDPQARINVGIRRRLAPLLKVRSKMELMNGLLMSMPGTPVLYYGDEIAMGDNIYLGDRNGVRTPMQWSGDRNAGFSRANPQRLYLPPIIDPEYHYEAINVEAQEANTSSLLWWTKRLLALRSQYKVFGRGDVRFLRPDNPKVLAYLRTYKEERILVVANLSRFPQYVELDLREFEGVEPLELFGQVRFPRVGELPYLLTLGPHNFYYFALERSADANASAAQANIPEIAARSDTWHTLLAGRAARQLERALPSFLQQARWYKGKAQHITAVTIQEVIPVPVEDSECRLLFLQVDFRDALSHQYQLPVLFVPNGGPAERLLAEHPTQVVARLADGVLADAAVDERFGVALFGLMARTQQLQGARGTVNPATFAAFRTARDEMPQPLRARVLGAEQSNTSINFGDRLILKLFRKLEEGINPDLELTHYLTEVRGFNHVPPLAGAVTYRSDRPKEPSAALASLTGFVQNQGDAWQLALDFLDRAFERVPGLEVPTPSTSDLGTSIPLMQRALQTPPELVTKLIAFLPNAALIGERTAEMHHALDGERENPDFVPEEFSTLYQRSLYQAARTGLLQSFNLLERKLRDIPERTRELARMVLGLRNAFDERLRRIVGSKIQLTRLRCHGDYHLGQLLFTGNDFYIVDFEGEPIRSVGERRLKQSPLRDVAGMLRSFHYAAIAALQHGRQREGDIATLVPWAEAWYMWVQAAFLGAYLGRARGSSFLPSSSREIGTLIDFFMIEKCSYEISYELNNRPDWLDIPLQGLRTLAADPTPNSVEAHELHR